MPPTSTRATPTTGARPAGSRAAVRVVSATGQRTLPAVTGAVAIAVALAVLAPASSAVAVGAAPSVAVGATPSVAVGAVPFVAVGATPSVAVGAVPSVAVGAVPSVAVGATPSVATPSVAVGTPTGGAPARAPAAAPAGVAAAPAPSGSAAPAGVATAFEASFTYDPESPAPGEPVTFAADVGGDHAGSLAFAWDWTGDGEFETTTDDPDGVEHAFPEPGEYLVTLRVTDDAGATATAERTVVVEGEPVATETAGPEPTATPPPTPVDGAPTAAWWYTPLDPTTGETVTLVAESAVEGATYGWDLDGDGGVDATGPTVSHAFGEPGDHEVTLRVSAPGTDALARTRTLAVEEARNAGERGGEQAGLSFWYTPLDPKPGETVTFVASPDRPDAVVAFGWDLDGDGSVDRRGPVASRAFAESGSVGVVLAVERPDGSVERVERTVTVEPWAGGPRPSATATVVETEPPAGLPVAGFGATAALAALVAALVAVRARRWRSGR